MFPVGMDPASLVQRLAVSIPGLLLALAFHEYCHARVAVRLGDPTPEEDGRLTMNPLAHLDPIGALMLVFVGFGWAKPVQVQGQHFKNPLRDMAAVAVAGPLANIVLATVSIVAWRLLEASGAQGPVFDPLAAMLRTSFALNVGLAVFNLLPLPPLDGSRVLFWLLPARGAEVLARFEPYAPIALIALVVTGVLGPVLRPLYAAVASLILWGTRF